MNPTEATQIYEKYRAHFAKMKKAELVDLLAHAELLTVARLRAKMEAEQ